MTMKGNTMGENQHLAVALGLIVAMFIVAALSSQMWIPALLLVILAVDVVWAMAKI
jgi:hypothetical protein